jgi:hypothetical protein
MAFTLNSWAGSYLIPVYDAWNKRNAQASPPQCGTFRADFLYEWPRGVLILEFDEFQHKHENKRCELVRMLKMAFGYGGRPVTFIRYNPDAFKIKGQTQRTTKATRESALLDLLQAGLYFEDFSNLITIHYVCYNNAASDALVQTYKFADASAYESWVEASSDAQ